MFCQSRSVGSNVGLAGRFVCPIARFLSVLLRADYKPCFPSSRPVPIIVGWFGSVRFGSIKILATTYCCHVVGTGFLELQSLLEFLQRVHDFLDRLGPLGRVLGKEILLLTGPDLGLGSGLRLRRRDDYLDGILVDAVLDHRRVGEDLPDRTQCRLVFLLPPVSVSGISDGELDRRTHGRNRR